MVLRPFGIVDNKTPEEIYGEDLKIAEASGVISDFAKPYFKKLSDRGVLLIHGFCASPMELKPLADALEDAGFSVYSVRVAGHGTNIGDMINASRYDWYDSLRLGYSALMSYCKKICVVGQSNGGLLASALAAYNKCDALALLAPAFKVRIPGFFLVPYLKNIIKFVPRFLKDEDKEYNYGVFPLKSLYQMKLLQNAAREYIYNINVPVMTAVSHNDILISPREAEKMLREMPPQDKTLLKYDNLKYKVKHILTLNHTSDIIKDITDWIEKRIK